MTQAATANTVNGEHRIGDKWRKWGDPSCRVYVTADVFNGAVWLEAEWSESFKGVKICAMWNPWDFVRVAEC